MGATVEGVSRESTSDEVVSEQFRELFDSVEDLIKRVAEIESPEIQKVRAQARVALMMAKGAVQTGATHVGRQALRFADTTDDYLRTYPWYAVGLGTLLGFGIGLMMARSGD